jgi:hypothetical protein
VSWLNRKPNPGYRENEIMLAAYYQLHLIGDIYLQPDGDLHLNSRAESELLAGHRDYPARHHPV